MIHKTLVRAVATAITTSLVLQLTACGTILYPERKGQKAGQLDTSIVILDAIGLLFYFVPGIIAFAVDFNNGTIYLPGGSAALDKHSDLQLVNHDGSVDQQQLKTFVERETGKVIDLSTSSVKAVAGDLSMDALHSQIRFL